jgi:predicted RNA binding protein YcfA (HicA-like mRNA interferase family)
MPKLPQVSATELVRAFQSMGFVKVSQKGSHIKMKDSTGRTAIIPNHKSIKPGTLKKGILNPLSISVEELINALS